MKVTIYVPDDLGAELSNHDDLNVSAIAQQALRQELDFRAAAAEIGEGFKREIYYDSDEERKRAFYGKELAVDDESGDLVAYLTEGEQIAILDGQEQRLWVYPTFDEVEHDEYPPGFVADVAFALGVEWVEEMAI
jgi:hypothetical protein